MGGPSLDILLKLMSMVALLIAPLIRGNEDWKDAWIGAIPLVVALVSTIVLNRVGILTWDDPLKDAGIGEKKEDPSALRSAANENENTPVVIVAAGIRPGSGGQAWD